MTTFYACTTTRCSERFRGFTDEPTFCSICMDDLTPFPADGRTLEEVNELAALAPRPLPEVDLPWREGEPSDDDIYNGPTPAACE